MPGLLVDDHRFAGPPLLRHQPQELSPYLGAPVIMPTTDVSTSTTTSVVTIADVLVGETVVFEIGTRGGAPNGVTAVSGLPADVTVEIIRSDNAGTPSISLVRTYYPSGMNRGTTVTFTFNGSPTKKTAFATKYANLANRPAIASAVLAGVSATAISAGTTGAFTEPGIHIAAWARGGSLIDQTTKSGVDEEGTFQTRVDLVGGATTPALLFVEDRPVTAPHASGVTATATASNGSTYAAVQAVWSLLDLVIAPTRPHVFLGASPSRRAGPPILVFQTGFDVTVGGVTQPITLTTSLATASSTLANTPGKALIPGVVTTTPILVKQPSHVFTPSVVTASPTLLKQAAKILTTSLATATATLLRAPGKLLTTSVATATALLSRMPGKKLTTSLVSASATLTRTAAHTITTSIATASASLAKQPQKILTTSVATATATLGLIKVKILALTTSLVTASAALTKQPNRVLAPNTVTVTATLAKRAARTFTTSASAIATLIAAGVSGAVGAVITHFTRVRSGTGVSGFGSSSRAGTNISDPTGETDTTGATGSTDITSGPGGTDVG